MNATHATLSADRFYWALLHVQPLPRAHRRDSKALGYLFEGVLPLPIEQVHATYAYVHDGTDSVIACGLPKDALAELVSQQPAALMLNPESLPAFLGDAAVDPRELDLLTGEFEPPIMRRAKRRLVFHAAICIVLLTALISIALHRRVAAIDARIAETQEAKQRVILATMGPASTSSRQVQPPELRMLAELRSLQQTRGRTAPARGVNEAESDDHQAGSVMTSFATLVGDWPRDLHIRTESISITPTSMTVRGVASSSGDVQALADALLELDGWRLQQPQMSAAGDGAVNATWQWKRQTQVPMEATP